MIPDQYVNVRDSGTITGADASNDNATIKAALVAAGKGTLSTNIKLPSQLGGGGLYVAYLKFDTASAEFKDGNRVYLDSIVPPNGTCLVVDSGIELRHVANSGQTGMFLGTSGTKSSRFLLTVGDETRSQAADADGHTFGAGRYLVNLNGGDYSKSNLAGLAQMKSSGMDKWAFTDGHTVGNNDRLATNYPKTIANLRPAIWSNPNDGGTNMYVARFSAKTFPYGYGLTGFQAGTGIYCFDLFGYDAGALLRCESGDTSTTSLVRAARIHAMKSKCAVNIQSHKGTISDVDMGFIYAESCERGMNIQDGVSAGDGTLSSVNIHDVWIEGGDEAQLLDGTNGSSFGWTIGKSDYPIDDTTITGLTVTNANQVGTHFQHPTVETHVTAITSFTFPDPPGGGGPPPPPPPPAPPTITASPPNPSSVNYADFTVTPPTGAIVQYKLDAMATWTTWPATRLTGLASGAHTIKFRSFDSTSGLNSTVVTYTWTINLVVDTVGEGHYTASVLATVTPGVRTPVNLVAKIKDKNAAGRRETVITRTVYVTQPVTGPPTASIISPAAGAQIQGTAVLFEADIASPSPLTSVQYQVGSGALTAMPLMGGSRYGLTVDIPRLATTVLKVVATNASGSDTKTVSVTQVATAPSNPTPSTIFIPAPTVGQAASFMVQHLTPTPDGSGTALGEIAGDDLRWGKYLNTSGYVSYDVNKASVMASSRYTKVWNTDFILWRDAEKLMEGEVRGAPRDTDDAYIVVGGNDFLKYFEDVVMPFNRNAPVNFIRSNVDMFKITEDLIDYVMNAYRNTLEINLNNGLAGIKQNQAFMASDLATLAELIAGIGQQAQGFDWEMRVGRRFAMYAPDKRFACGLVLDTSNIKTLHYDNPDVPPTTMYGGGSGSGGTRAISRQIDSSRESFSRHRDAVADFGTVASLTALDQLTLQRLNQQGKIDIDLVVTVQPSPGENYWSLAETGSLIPVQWPKDQNLDPISGTFRCTAMEGYVNNQGDEQIVFTFNVEAVS